MLPGCFKVSIGGDPKEVSVLQAFEDIERVIHRGGSCELQMPVIQECRLGANAGVRNTMESEAYEVKGSLYLRRLRVIFAN
jgi:hypothetical protein